MQSAADLSIGTIIRVDRPIRPAYPSFVHELLYPSLEQSGPSDFNLADIDQRLFGKQNDVRGGELGSVVHQYLQVEDLLNSCLNLQDALAIKEMRARHYRQHFPDKTLYFWKSAAQCTDGMLKVPALNEAGDRVMLTWRWVLGDMNSRCITPLFRVTG